MAWTSPRTWVSGELVTASQMNTHVRDNLNALRAGNLDDLVVSGTGPHAIGGSVINSTALYLTGAFTSDGSGTARGLLVDYDLTAASGDTTGIAAIEHSGTITTQGASETIPVVAGLWIDDPKITVGTGDTVDAAASLYVQAAPTEGTNNYALWVDDGLTRLDGNVFINETANANMTTGLTVMGGDDEVFALKNSSVAHGITDWTETDTYAWMGTASGAGAGGLRVESFTEGTVGAIFLSVATTEDTTKSASGNANHRFDSWLKTGTGAGAHGADANLFAIREGTSTRFIVDKDGDIHRDGTDNTFADYDDPMLLLAFEHALAPKAAVDEVFARYCQYNRRSLVDAGVLHESGFYNESALLRLTVGGVWQTAVRQRELEDRVAAIESNIERIEGRVQ